MPLPTRRLALSAALWLLCGAPALAASSSDAKTPAPAPKKRRRTSSVPRYANGQTEAQRQRSEEARLRRECKGRPNAGACMGYTR